MKYFLNNFNNLFKVNKISNNFLVSILSVICFFEISFAGGAGDYAGGGVGVLFNLKNIDGKNEEVIQVLDLVINQINTETNQQNYLLDAPTELLSYLTPEELNTFGSYFNSELKNIVNNVNFEFSEKIVDLLINIILRKVKNQIPNLGLKLLNNYTQTMNWHFTDKPLEFTFDQSDENIDVCKYLNCIQLARFDFFYIKIYRPYYLKLDIINRVALKLHELFYSYSTEVNSVKIQKLVSKLLSRSFYSMKHEEIFNTFLTVFSETILTGESLPISFSRPEQLERIYQYNFKPNKTKCYDVKNIDLKGELEYFDEDDFSYERKQVEYLTKALKGKFSDKADTNSIDIPNYAEIEKVVSKIKNGIENKYPKRIYPTGKWDLNRVCIDVNDNILRSLNYKYTVEPYRTNELTKSEAIANVEDSIDQEIQQELEDEKSFKDIDSVEEHRRLSDLLLKNQPRRVKKFLVNLNPYVPMGLDENILDEVTLVFRNQL